MRQIKYLQSHGGSGLHGLSVQRQAVRDAIRAISPRVEGIV
jgi:hypothetical protein